MLKITLTFILLGYFSACVNSQLKIPSIPTIINGNAADAGQFPWQVAIWSFLSDLKECSGVIINENWVLTTASCIEKEAYVLISAGAILRNGNDGRQFVADNYTIHPEFDNITLQNDIGLFQLTTDPLFFTDKIKAIKLPDSNEKLEEGITATIAGWGHSNNDIIENRTAVLQYANVTTISNEDCQAIYGKDTISESVVCTVGDSNQSPCFGDAGAPLVVNDEAGDPVVVGIFSFISALGCENYPAGYQSVGYYRKWIEEITGI